MLRVIKFVVATVFFLVLYVTTLAPAIEDVSNSLQTVNDGAGPLTMWGAVESALFVAMPLLLLGGVILVGFVIAFGLRGTSFQ